MLPRHNAETYQCNELTRNPSKNARPQSSQLGEPLWIDPGLKRRTGARELISTFIFPHIFASEEKATTTLTAAVVWKLTDSDDTLLMVVVVVVVVTLKPSQCPATCCSSSCAMLHLLTAPVTVYCCHTLPAQDPSLSPSWDLVDRRTRNRPCFTALGKAGVGPYRMAPRAHLTGL